MRTTRLPAVCYWSAVLITFMTMNANGDPLPAHALVVGSNRPGEGQETLRFAHNDAGRFGEVLEELGGYEVQQLLDPDVATLKRGVERISAILGGIEAEGRQSAFVFYYSGHARANALNLGDAEFSLTELREILEAVPATIKVIVLDACQTGAFTQAKGLEPARDFSHNSVFGLTNEGIAVIASSSASELAQESDNLKGSFFTHHLVAGLRGAADNNDDGRVTLSEAYQYTYNRTLLDTARTAIGKQHVTLETDLSGEGEMVLVRPDVASAWLHLPERLEGEVLVYRKRDRIVMAEIHKAKRDELRLALPPGDYGATVRQKSEGYECDISLLRTRTATLDLDDCEPIPLEKLNAKGAEHRRDEHLFFELGMGMLFTNNSQYEARMTDFGYEDDYIGDNRFYYAVGAFYSPLRYLQIGIAFSPLDRGGWTNHTALYSDTGKQFSWHAYRTAAHVRGALPLANDWLVLFLEAAIGFAWANTIYTDNRYEDAVVKSEERYFGVLAGGNAGVQLNFSRFVGVFAQGGYYYAPVIDNEIGDTHNSGGATFTTGVRAGF